MLKTISRRAMLVHVSAATCAFVSARCPAQSNYRELVQRGCFASNEGELQEAELELIRGRSYLKTTGDDKKDAAVTAQLFRAARAFALDQAQLPSFRFLPPGNSGGFSSDRVKLDVGTKGLVAVGIDLANSSNLPEIALTAFEVIVGHEFAHIYQARRGYVEALTATESTVKFLELHADYLAGWFMSKRDGLTRELFNFTVQILFDRGDYRFNEPSHHGTKAERFTAVFQGFHGGSLVDHVDGAARNGLKFVEELRNGMP